MGDLGSDRVDTESDGLPHAREVDNLGDARAMLESGEADPETLAALLDSVESDDGSFDPGAAEASLADTADLASGEAKAANIEADASSGKDAQPNPFGDTMGLNCDEHGECSLDPI